MPPHINLLELQAHYRRSDDLIAIHYGCENLYAAVDHPAAVSCVAFCRVERADAGSFSVVDFAHQSAANAPEIAVLTEYFDFVRQNAGAAILHWNMSKADYGFSALEARYRFLTGEEPPYGVPRDRTYDLDDLIANEYGPDYAPHPRLVSLAALNSLSRHHALGGREEADKFESGDHGSVRRSIDEKARWIAMLGVRFLDGQLKTARSVGSVEFAGGNLDAVQAVIEVARRMLYVQRELARRHQGRPTLRVEDEYDAQDLFRSLLRLFFHDVRSEDFVPSSAGANSRVDFVLRQFQMAVELKHSRPTMTAKSLGEELLVDVARYGERADIGHLVCVVFDHGGHLENPRGLEADLSRESSAGGTAVTVIIVDR